MENQDLVTYKYNKGKREVFPAHPAVKNWLFNDDEEDEAMLVHFMATVGEKAGMNSNDYQHLFPAVLRMLKSKSVWAMNEK
ncbi:hypothetical protein MUN82_08870 [Hymenobacter aerilatus]|uniref:Uncharacterized protein n=1 Tax=Hymenobacter aerilatus TaxID=2932251 RepID=A0A8T9SZA8_9BACT|nr:hypothetical protein [Hymenobacter aerilatus]UOR07195.1 hypothetical protein MUN82_08870 [Hymenobacter aerilatus]